MSNKISYDEFVNSKRVEITASGFSMDRELINSQLFEWQGDIVRWALYRGKAALFANCGLGKTPMQIEWAKQVCLHTGGNVLILAPLGVVKQTQREGDKFGVAVTVCRASSDVRPGVNITNYDMMKHFDPADFVGIVLDESSLLKGGTLGIMFNEIVEFGSTIDYRLCCTATPAPNDIEELIAHSEFLGIMRSKEVKALYFTQDGNDTTKWRLKRYAEKDFWKWMAEWSIALRKPSDLGYSDDGFVLPPLNVHQVTVDLDAPINDGQLFAVEAVGLAEQRKAGKLSLEGRVQICADMVNELDEPCAVWVNMNYESEAITQAIPGAVEITGSDSSQYKEDSLLGFASGSYRVMVTKPRIAGFGMNFQHCCKVFVVGLSHSYEQYYQLIRRFHRFGQTKPVDVYVIVSSADGQIVENIKRKEQQSMTTFDNIVKHMSVNIDLKAMTSRNEMEYKEDVQTGDDWTLYLGDSVKRMDEIADNSVGFSIYSPPFPGMYVFSNSAHDAGNVKTVDQMIEQFRYFVDAEHLLRITKPGRSTCIHLAQLTAQKLRDGYIGIKDFRGKVIQMMEDEGWIYYGEVCIDKNPQLKAIRTKDSALQFKSLATDSARMHMALADYVLQFKKPGENTEPIRAGLSTVYGNDGGWITNKEWILWARPVWYAADFQPGTWRPEYTGDSCPDGISETNVLNVSQARDTNDERHLCPLQLDVIERAIKLWSNPGDVVFSPFAGIGSEGYVALKYNRKFIGCELKESYWRSAVGNLKNAAKEKGQSTLFDMNSF